MIKFFRRIRYDLMEKNPPERHSRAGKTGKPALPSGRYLKYALGEIVLVVIGILIALSINNWNENRKAEITKHMLLQELKQEFQGNLKLIEKQEISLTKSNNYLITVLNYSAGKEKDLPIDSLRKFSSKMIYINNLAITKSSVDGIIASGNISLMDNDLTSLLTEFESEFNSLIYPKIIANGSPLKLSII